MHNRGVRRTWVRSVGGGLLLCALLVATVLVLGGRGSSPAADATPPSAASAEAAEKGGHGPPPWAHAGGADAKRGHAADSWKDEWRSFSPAQKARRMTSLARAHERGMRDWSRCVRDAGSDQEERRACEKPLPPGLAKKQS